MEEGHAKKVSVTAMVATQSRFHRDRLDGEPTVSKAMRFDLVPTLQVVTIGLVDARLGLGWLRSDGLDGGGERGGTLRKASI
jgi:hypothetical protein